MVLGYAATCNHLMCRMSSGPRKATCRCKFPNAYNGCPGRQPTAPRSRETACAKAAAGVARRRWVIWRDPCGAARGGAVWRGVARCDTVRNWCGTGTGAGTGRCWTAGRAGVGRGGPVRCGTRRGGVGRSEAERGGAGRSWAAQHGAAQCGAPCAAGKAGGGTRAEARGGHGTGHSTGHGVDAGRGSAARQRGRAAGRGSKTMKGRDATGQRSSGAE